MKVIDLLNKIANEEEVPKKIRFDNTYWNRICGEKNIYYKNDYDSLFVYFFKKDLTFTLNDEVEIIEEDKKIEKLEHMNSRDYLENRNEYLSTKDIALDIETLRHWINKIIDKLNSMEE